MIIKCGIKTLFLIAKIKCGARLSARLSLFLLGETSMIARLNLFLNRDRWLWKYAGAIVSSKNFT
jgi:hypothetical protein